MLRLPQLDVEVPRSVEAAVAFLAEPRARPLAGGTDLLPNLKHRLGPVPRLVSIHALEELRRIEVVDGHLLVGAGVRLADVARDALVLQHAPSLVEAAAVVASPPIRNMATLGGNVNLDTRCRYLNQTEFWRGALGGCLKTGGHVCHVVPGGRRCVAAISSDTVPVLVTLDAVLVLRRVRGAREVPIAEYFRGDGTAHTVRKHDELLTHVRIPLPRGPRRARYVKWTVRQSIDFPLVSIALRFDLDRDSPDAVIKHAAACVGVIGATPMVIAGLESLVGQPLDSPTTRETLATLAHKQCKPLENVPYDAAYRRAMIPVYIRRSWPRPA